MATCQNVQTVMSWHESRLLAYPVALDIPHHGSLQPRCYTDTAPSWKFVLRQPVWPLVPTARYGHDGSNRCILRALKRLSRHNGKEEGTKKRRVRYICLYM